MLPLFAGLAVVFYFLLIRPQRKQAREFEQMLKGLKKNDSVRTTGGIFGKVVSVDNDQVILKVDENQNVRLRVLRSSIATVLDRDEEKQTPAAAAVKSR